MIATSKMCLIQLLIVMFFLILCTLNVCVASDIISLGESLNANQTLISKEGNFELGFFSPGNSSNSYIGIWYKNIPVRTVVWVANRNNPIRQISKNSQLVLSQNGTLQLLSDSNTQIWAVSYGGSSSANKAVLLDTGNFVLSDGLGVLWQSFDYPTDTWLPGAKIGTDRASGNTTQVLTSWKNLNDPSPGIFSLGMDQNDSTEIFIYRYKSQIFWRSGTWNGRTFLSIPEAGNMTKFRYISDGQGTPYITYSMTVNDPTIRFSRYVMSYTGQFNRLIWLNRFQTWNISFSAPQQKCDRPGLCGAFGVCDFDSSPVCQCIEGFYPSNPEKWALSDFSGGCERSVPLRCDDGFEKISNIRLPAYSRAFDLDSHQECEGTCSVNCSCIAYAYTGRCLLWAGDLYDSERLVHSGENFYLRLPGPYSKRDSQKKKHFNVLPLLILLPLLICIALPFVFWLICRKRNKKTESKEANLDLLLFNLDSNKDHSNNISADNIVGGKKETFDLPQFSFSSISIATNNFSIENKLGEGGFGPVYKGNLLDGQSVAVKRLSERSVQGLEELRNEMVVIAKLQHRNLVKLLGCCLEQNEKILIYEYMPNKSLDWFLFDPDKRGLLDWRRRVQIIEGIAQGLLYLHRHSRLRIVHRDLKASNILLDGEMNPKISDFGMARIFGGDVMQANTRRVVGTYGYMSPEYAMEGLFSVKSDVFAFGVLLLEILSGKKNTGFRNSDCLSLLGYAWELWISERVVELIDSKLDIIPSDSFKPRRFIHVGLLCVQEYAADRPSISDVLAMINNESMNLVSPKRPAFTGSCASSGTDKAEHCSVNDLTASVMPGR